jgi:serine/alanine adding enzyme
LKRSSDFSGPAVDDATDRCMPQVKLIQAAEHPLWDSYVREHPQAGVYHLSGWRSAIEGAYGYPTYYLMAVASNADGSTAPHAVQGLLPLIHMRSLFFGNHLISMPFFDSAGIVCATPQAGRCLAQAALRLGKRLGVQSVELRQNGPLPAPVLSETEPAAAGATEKVRMLLELPATSAELMASFKSKVRSQVKNPIAKGLKTRVGGIELLDDFYSVFSENMRDLGSPVHSRRLIAAVLQAFGGNARIFMIDRDRQPLATSLVVGFKQMLCNPWSSSLRRYRSLNANMLLYWRMLEYGCEHGFRCFDFGRSAPDEGTYKFKQQWGAQPVSLLWYTLATTPGNAIDASPDKKNYKNLIQIWRRLPLPLTRIIGPPIRKRINL